jgi:hypothetical protein
MGKYSIKPGRGPSAASAVGGIIGVVFGIFWTILAFTITADAPWPIIRIIFPGFGILFVIAGIASVFYNTHNATQPNRFSDLDIVPSDSEPDPLTPGRQRGGSAADEPTAAAFCSQCGTGLRADDKFCSKCGAKVAG